MKLILLASALMLAQANSLVTHDPAQWVSQWNQNDVKLFLLDRNIPFDQSSDPSILSDLAVKELQSLAEQRKTVIDVSDLESAELLKAAADPNRSLDNLIVKNEVDYLSSGVEIKQWLFSSWSGPQLRSLLKANHIPNSKKRSTPDLVLIVQKNFDKIAKNNDASGNYLGNWLFETWSDSDLRDWLNRFDVEHKATEKRDDLIRSVKEHAFIVLESLSDSKLALLDSLRIEKSDLFDKAGDIKADFFDTWSYSQLREWLYTHGLIDTKPGVYSKELLLDSVKKMAVANAKYFKDDVSSWSGAVAEKTKASSESFLDGIDKWQKLRLREFLDARKIDSHRFASKADLVKLVKEHRDKPATKDSISFIKSWLVENLSTEAMQEWLKLEGQNPAGSREELLVALLSYLASSDAVAKIPSTIKLQLKHYEPDFSHYRDWLVGKGVDLENVGEETIKGTFDLVKQYFSRAGSSLETKFDHTKGNAEDALQNAQDSAYDYALRAVKTFKDDKESIEGRFQKARDAADSYCKEKIDSLTDSYSSAADSVASFAGYKHPSMPGPLRRWLGYVGLGEIIAGKAKTIYMSGTSTASLQLSSVYEAAALAGADGVLYASEGYEAASSAAVAGELYASEGYDAAALMASDGYDAASRAAVAGELYASEGYDAAALMASDGYEAASRAAVAGELYASEGYDAAYSAAIVGQLYASEGYDAAALMASDGYEAASRAAVAGELYASEGYDAASSAAIVGQLYASEGYDAASRAAVVGELYASDGYDAASLAAKVGALYASEGYDAASSIYSQAADAAPTYVSSASSAIDEAYKQGTAAAAVAQEHAAGIIDAAGSYAAAATDLAKEMAEKFEDGWTYLLKTWSNSDLRSYLQSFGHDHSTLHHMNRRQLLGLAHQQSSFFHGSGGDKWHKTVPQFIKESAGIFRRKPQSMWEKPFPQIVADAANGVLRAVHLQ